MAEYRKNKYYFLKLPENFFEKDEIKIIEKMTNGDKYIVFYFKLLCKAIQAEGQLRLNQTIPYNDEMLATLTDTDIDVVRSAIKVFVSFGLLEIWDDQTIYMTQMQHLIGYSTPGAAKKKEQRLRAKEKATAALPAYDCENTKQLYGEFKNIEINDSEMMYLQSKLPQKEIERRIELLSEQVNRGEVQIANATVAVLDYID
jgi:predicted phage replisome organizer